MRTLLLTRGAPGCGKSTFIKDHNLENYTLSPDNLRLLISSTAIQPDGNFVISQANEKVVWNLLFEILEYRMKNGEFTVIDATCSKTKDIKQYKDLADKYRYRMFIVDFTDIPLDICLRQNLQRPVYKHVPEEVIKNIYARFATQEAPSGVTIIKRDEVESVILEQPYDLSKYNKLVFVGDIHGCYDTLMQYTDFKNGLSDDTAYIFCGDYLDRGDQNYEVLRFINSIKDKPNVCLLEGNHERSLYAYGNDEQSNSKQFEKATKYELITKGFSAKEARMLYRKLRQFSHITYHGLDILACHGGIPNLNTNLLYIPSTSFIRGVGRYEDYKILAESWISQTKLNQYLVHGHRNVDNDEVMITDRVFNLEGKVEFSGKLRIVELTMKTETQPFWNIVELASVQPIIEDVATENISSLTTIDQALTYLRHDKFVSEKQLGDNISSFNFTRDAFYTKNWNTQTILARGLFINTEKKEIIARSYEKFLRINETPATEISTLKTTLQFPVTAYVKENGFLAIVSYNPEADDLFIASKSTNTGDYVRYIKEQLKDHTNILKILREYYKNNNSISLVFECEDIENDPHIIKYTKNNLVLLDAIKNKLEYQVLPYEVLSEIAVHIKCEVKEKAYIFNTWAEFKEFYDMVVTTDYTYNNRRIEGFVFQDNIGFMTKLKTNYYNQWKKLRGVADQTLRAGYITKTGMLINETENLFYGFCKKLYDEYFDIINKVYPFKTDIISLRDQFYKTTNIL